MRVPSWAYGAAASVAIAAFALVTTADLGGLLVGESPSPEIARQATETLGAAPEADLTGTLPPQSPQPAAVPEDGTPALVAAAQAPGAVVEAAQPTGAPDQEAFSAAANADVQKLQPAPVAPEEAAPSLPAEPVVADERATAASSVDNAAASEETKTETATGEGLPQPEAATSEPVAPPAPVPGPTGTVVAQPVPAPTAPALAVTAPGATAPAEEATPTLTPPSLAVTAPGATRPKRRGHADPDSAHGGSRGTRCDHRRPRRHAYPCAHGGASTNSNHGGSHGTRRDRRKRRGHADPCPQRDADPDSTREAARGAGVLTGCHRGSGGGPGCHTGWRNICAVARAGGGPGRPGPGAGRYGHLEAARGEESPDTLMFPGTNRLSPTS